MRDRAKAPAEDPARPPAEDSTGELVTTTPAAPTDSPSRPALVTIDGDPAVSRAVARDLRRRYGQNYRIVRAESGADALDALREMKLKGAEVAVLLADYRMPLMSGIEFLEQAMDLFPFARRVLLTAYTDTSAAIDAINVVDLMNEIEDSVTRVATLVGAAKQYHRWTGRLRRWSTCTNCWTPR